MLNTSTNDDYSPEQIAALKLQLRRDTITVAKKLVKASAFVAVAVVGWKLIQKNLAQLAETESTEETEDI